MCCRSGGNDDDDEDDDDDDDYDDEDGVGDNGDRSSFCAAQVVAKLCILDN